MDLLFDGRYEDAESHFLYLAREFSRSSTTESKLHQAMALYQAGRIERLYLGQPRRAITRYREALELSSGAAFAFDARREIALIFHDRLRDYRSAVIELEQLVQSFPERKDIDHYRFRIAQGYFLLRDFDQARSAAKGMLEKGTTDPGLLANAMLLIANSYYAQSKYELAVDTHKKLLLLKPGDEIESRSSFELGMCYLELGDFRTAEQHLLQALERHTRPDIVRYQLMILQERMSEEDDESLPKLPSATSGRKLVIEVKAQGTKSSIPKEAVRVKSQPSQKQSIVEQRDNPPDTSRQSADKKEPIESKVTKTSQQIKAQTSSVESEVQKAPDPADSKESRNIKDTIQKTDDAAKVENVTESHPNDTLQPPKVDTKKPVEKALKDPPKDKVEAKPEKSSPALKTIDPADQESSKPSPSNAPSQNKPDPTQSDDKS